MKPRNNRLIGYGLGLVLYFIAFTSAWSVLKPGQPGVPFPVAVTGAAGSLGLEGVSVPIWILLLISAVTTVICALNSIGFSSIPKLPLYAALVLTGLYYLWPLVAKCLHPQALDLKAGPMLAFLANYWVARLTFVGSRGRTQEAQSGSSVAW